MSDQYQRVKALFERTVERPPDERATFLADACGDDVALRAEVERLLTAHEKAGSVLEIPARVHDLVRGNLAELTTSDVGRLAPRVQLGPYEIVALIGAGGMGEVYRARDPRLGRDIAIKVLPRALASDPDRLRRFKREASAAAALNHPNICTIHEIGDADGRAFIAMEYVEGMTLRDCLASGSLAPTRVVSIALQIADALEAARTKHIVHRDLKSANIVLTTREQVKILDFGLAKQLVFDETAGHATTLSGATEEGIVLGTLAYMAPEQALGRPVDHRSDLFAVGVILYELVTGRLPFAGESAPQVLDAILHQTPPSVLALNPQIPPDLAQLISRLLEKEPAARYQTAEELGRDLRQIQAGARLLPPPTKHLLSRSRRGYMALIGGLVVVIAALLMLPFGALEKRADPTAAATSIVALPAQVFGAPEFSYLTDAVPATLSTHLAQVQGLDTKVPPTTLELEPIRGDLARVAEVYGVTACVLTSITAVDDRLALNVQLVEPRTRRVRWSQQYEGPRGQYLDLVRQAADGLRQAVKPDASPVVADSTLTTNSEAELALRRGQHYADRYNNLHDQTDFNLAFTSLKRALELDPTLAEAAAEIAGLHIYRIEGGATPADAAPEIEWWAREALKINPRSGKALGTLVLAEVHHPRASSRKMVEYGLRAATFGPRCAECQNSLGIALEAMSFALSLEVNLQAKRLEPLFLPAYLNVALCLRYLGRAAEAAGPMAEARRLEPESPNADYVQTLLQVELGRIEEATALVRRVEAHGREQRLPTFVVLIAQHAVALERRDTTAAEAALAAIRKTVADPRTSIYDVQWVPIDVVSFLARRHSYEPAIELLLQCAKAGVIPPYDWLVINPHVTTLRHDPRLKEVVAKSRLQFNEMLRILDEARVGGEMPPYLERPLQDLRRRLGV